MIGARISWFYVKPSPLIPQDDWHEIMPRTATNPCGDKPFQSPIRILIQRELLIPHDSHDSTHVRVISRHWRTFKIFQGSMMRMMSIANRCQQEFVILTPSCGSFGTGTVHRVTFMRTWSTLGFQVRNFEFTQFTPSFSASHVDPLSFRANL